ncbi:hypothetical protein JB92DRAFT_2761411, partial [Gautieria morchelliformis]
TFGVPLGMKVINGEQRVNKKFRFVGETVWPQGTGKIIDNQFGGYGPVCENCRKNIIAAFTMGDAVEAITDAVSTPTAHNTTCEPLSLVSGVVFGALATVIPWWFSFGVMGQTWIRGVDADGRLCVKTPSLHEHDIWSGLKHQWVSVVNTPPANLRAWSPTLHLTGSSRIQAGSQVSDGLGPGAI